MSMESFPLKQQRFSTLHEPLKNTLLSKPSTLIIQDLDGVCMGLVRDPLTRTLSADYIHAAKKLSGEFYVLTNGEHIGERGVNALVERALGDPQLAQQQNLYLPGLGGGGVQWQNAAGDVSHPGVTEAELNFLAGVPNLFRDALENVLTQAPFLLTSTALAKALDIIILNNPVSPTINANALIDALGGDWQRYYALQQQLEIIMNDLLVLAQQSGLADSFFVHYAPNLGRSSEGERIKWATAQDWGTTDFQFMLRGAIKEVGVLVILNHYYHQVTGRFPLGEQFNAREAPHDHGALVELVKQHFDPAFMPCIVGVGDTLTSQSAAQNDDTYLRGGSDRGFLTLIQSIAQAFDQDHAVLFVDSSHGELTRPSIKLDALAQTNDPWSGMQGITDPLDPLQINFVFPGGHTEYVRFFMELSQEKLA
jgi:glucosylglycerol 3-phosphatase